MLRCLAIEATLFNYSRSKIADKSSADRVIASSISMCFRLAQNHRKFVSFFGPILRRPRARAYNTPTRPKNASPKPPACAHSS
jgi:hypothetical protein